MKKIAVIMNGLIFDSQRDILEEIYKKSEELQTDVYVFTSYVLGSNGRKALEGAHRVFEVPDYSLFDGVIVTPNTLMLEETREWLFEELKRLGTTVVNVDYHRDDIPYTMGDNYRGMYELVNHLITVHKKKKFFYLSGPAGNRDAEQRKQAFLDALAEHGITIAENEIYEGNFAPASGKQAMDYWKAQGVALPEAIVCANDAMAQGIMIELGYWGMRIPEDILVTGVDNSRVAAESQPRMTTIERLYSQRGGIACQLLMEKWQGKDISGKRINIPHQVIYSESCGCNCDQTLDIREYKRKHMLNDFYNQEIASIINSMISDFSGCNSFWEVTEVLKKYVVWTDAECFYLCMNDLKQIFEGENQDAGKKEDTDLTNGYSEFMTVPLAYEYGEFTSYGSYPRGFVLPEGVKRKDKPMHYITIPLHYQNECFGYCVFANSNFPIDRSLCYTWVWTITDAIQNVRKNLRLTETVRRLNDMWVYDTLTQVYNRAGFFHLSRRLMQEAQYEAKNMFVLFMDMDGLKLVNDAQGHDAGDHYICAVANILKRVTDENELVMRYGGDEFAVIGKFRSYNRAEELMQEIEAEIALENRSGDFQSQLSISIGCEIFDPRSEENLERVLERADREMYQQKRRKNNKT